MKSDEVYAFIDKYKEDDYEEPIIKEILELKEHLEKIILLKIFKIKFMVDIQVEKK